MTPPSTIEIPLKSGIRVSKRPNGGLALAVVETMGPKASRRFVEQIAEMLGLQVVEKDAP